MLDKKLSTKKIGFEARKAYGLRLQNNIKKYGSLNFNKDKILPKELKQKDFVKIAKDVENGIIVLNREFSNIEKDYQKFLSERIPKIKELENKNKKLVNEFKNINKKLNVYDQYQTLLKEKENQKRELELKTMRLRKQQENLEQIIKSLKKQRQVVLNNINEHRKQQEKYLENQYKQEMEIKFLKDEIQKKREIEMQNYIGLNSKKEELTKNTAKLQEEIKTIEELNNSHDNNMFDNDVFRQLAEKITMYKSNHDIIEWNKERQDIIDVKLQEIKEKLESLTNEEFESYYKIIQKYKTKKYIPYDIWSLNRQNSSLLGYITNMEYQMKLLKEKVEKLLLSHNKMTNEISDIRNLSNKVIGIGLYEQYCKQVNKLQKQIFKNQNQIDKLNQEIGVEKRKYNKKEKAYKRAFSLYQNQQKGCNNSSTKKLSNQERYKNY